MKEQIQLSWGDPQIVRQALTETLGHKFSLSATSLLDQGYPPHYGNPILIDQLKTLTKRQTGHKPKHLFVTCGAIGAIHAALFALKDMNTDYVLINRRYFPFYPQIIANADMNVLHNPFLGLLNTKYKFISLIDSPSNPEGMVSPFQDIDIWDAAYASKTYSSGGHVPNKFKIVCGSLSKTLGLAGLRLGWAATDDDRLAQSLGNWVTSNYIGLSLDSMKTAENIIKSLDFDKFETRSSGYLDDNREQMQKVLDRFGQGNVPTRGMFAIMELGKAERKALEKANVIWQPGNSWGEDENWARLSLGATRETIRKAVKGILK